MTNLNLFDTQVDKFDKYTQIPFTEDKLLQAYIYRGSQSRYDSQRRDYDILPLSNLFDFIDVDVITEILCQKPVTDLMEAINDYNESYKHICFDMHRKKIVDYERFDLALTKSLAWKAGTYAHILKVIDYFEGRHMRAAGMDSLFKRRVNNEGYIDYHRNRLNRLDALRATAKRMVGTKEADASKYKDRMLNTMDTINKATEEGNNVSDKIRISHYFTTNEYNSDTPYSFLDMFLITKVEIEPMMMFYTKGNDVVFKIQQPAMTTFYPRPLYKVLNGDRKHDHTLMGYSKAKHSYLQDYSIWHTNGHNVSKSPWNTVCLSGHQDDVLRNMSLHKYGDAAYALTLWGSSYNLEFTNPYNGPNQLIYQQGLDTFADVNNDIENPLMTVTDVLGINTRDCFTQRLHRHRAVWLEETPNGHRIINKLDDPRMASLEIFAHSLIEECKNCPIIEDCHKMQLQLEYEKVRDEYLPIVEAIVAEIYDLDNVGHCLYDVQWSTIAMLHKLAINDDIKRDSIIIDKLDEAGFFKEPLTAEEQALEDARIAQLQAQRAMEQWALGATHGEH